MLVKALRLIGYAILPTVPETHPAGLWQPIELLGILFQTVCPHQVVAAAIAREGLDAFSRQVIAAKTRRQRLWRRMMRTMGMRWLIPAVWRLQARHGSTVARVVIMQGSAKNAQNGQSGEYFARITPSLSRDSRYTSYG